MSFRGAGVHRTRHPSWFFFGGAIHPLDCRRFVHSARLHGPSGVDIHPVVPSPSRNQQHQQHQHSVTVLAQDCHTNEVFVQSWLNVSSSFRPSRNEMMCHQESTLRQQCPTLHQRPPGSTRSFRMSTWRQHQQFHLLHQHLRGTTLGLHQQITPHLLLPWITRQYQQFTPSLLQAWNTLHWHKQFLTYLLPSWNTLRQHQQ